MYDESASLIDFQLNPQVALDAPRWQWIEDNTIELERSFPEHLTLPLETKGHVVKYIVGSGGFERGQIIIRDEKGIIVGGTDPRIDGAVAVW
ncbi:gamma-glutamyltransferase [Brevibacterium sp. JNUCC-42]|nr:gamma-glutamyltransferase [Brevibacterium sp. JNUCC-42]